MYFAPYISNFKFRPAISLSSSLKSGRFLQVGKLKQKKFSSITSFYCLGSASNFRSFSRCIFNFLFDVCAFLLIYAISCLALSDGWGGGWGWADSTGQEISAPRPGAHPISPKRNLQSSLLTARIYIIP